jgi:predicted helicase
MPTDHRAALADVKTFPKLIAYLRDEMDWPISQDSFEEIDDLFYDFSPDELGIDPGNSAKIEEIRRLRPLSPQQPWGIFFVKFQPRKLPVVALRRILGSVVKRKRPGSGLSERTVWDTDDLLFISNFGESGERNISFAHFCAPADQRDLPTLKVLGWDNENTALHLDAVADDLTRKLAWPNNPSDTKKWREQWSSAFRLEHREVINTSKQLSVKLAELASRIRDRIRSAMRIETDKGKLTQLMNAFQTALVHDLDPDGFADMYAQTIAYGLLSARIADPHKKTADDFAAHMRTNPFLRELMETFLKVGGRQGKAGGQGIDFDELGVSEIVELLDDANMEAVVRDFGDRNPQEDPVIHFYELFLKEYDAKRRMQRGVFYTPRPVVSYIVHSVDELLRTEFGLADGLADTTTWGEMAKRHKDLVIPVGVSPDLDFVQIIDPATGTGTFLVEVIDHINKTLVAKWKAQGHNQQRIDALWNGFVPKHLLPRLHGYEVLMAPYAIAHLKIGLKLYETGYRFDSDERARIYLTNALEPAQDFSERFEFAIPALAHEAKAVNAIKRNQRFTVVIGNPPYSVTSANFNLFIDTLMDDYKKHVRGEQGLVALADDYLKFVRMSQRILEESHCGIWGMITNHGYLKGVIHRGVRRELLDQFNLMFILDLHGDTNIGERVPAGKTNENVFDIQQGVAVSIGACKLANSSARSVRHSDLWGSRIEKYQDLVTHPISRRKWSEISPVQPRFFLFPFDDANLFEYEEFPSLDTLMSVNSCGVKTHRDGVVIDFDKKTLAARMSDIASERRLELLRERYGITDTPNWNLKDAQQKIKADEVPRFIQRLTYRPFDHRWIYYNPVIIEKGDSKYPTLRHMLRSNVALLSARIQATGVFDAVFASKFLVEMKTAESSRSCTVFPLFLTEDAGSRQAEFPIDERKPNLNSQILSSWAHKLGLKATGNFSLPSGLTPEDIFHYAYAVLHSPGYRSRYAQFLKIDFPRLPLTGSLKLLRALARLGEEITTLHLLESPKLEQPTTEFIGGREPEVEKISWSNNTVWLNKARTIGFKGVRDDVWNFHIGGYKVCEKWLKDRKGRTLSKDDIAHYQKIVVALAETIRLMKQIDEVIEQHGGWPGAFAIAHGQGTET